MRFEVKGSVLVVAHLRAIFLEFLLPPAFALGRARFDLFDLSASISVTRMKDGKMLDILRGTFEFQFSNLRPCYLLLHHSPSGDPWFLSTPVKCKRLNLQRNCARRLSKLPHLLLLSSRHAISIRVLHFGVPAHNVQNAAG